MNEKIFSLSTSNEKTVEKVIQDENLDYIHMIFNKGERLPLHYSNSNVYMTVLQDNLSIGLDDQEVHIYPVRTILKIPYKTKMNVRNKYEAILELLAIKAHHRIIIWYKNL
jgi:quercetin dioxygenase-like cupin family protein